MTLRRGFKKEANGLALEARGELDLPPHSPLCPFALAEHLSIPVYTTKQLVALDNTVADHVRMLLNNHASAFSAMTVFEGRRRCIIHNHLHALVRQRSNVSHEVAHALLAHPPHPPSCANGDRVYKRELEEEASWLGPVLLVSNEAARWAVAKRMSLADAAAHFEVSGDLMEFRLRMSGALKIQQRKAYGINSRAAS